MHAEDQLQVVIGQFVVIGVICNKWYHIRCAAMVHEEYIRLTNSTEEWLCNTCNPLIANRQQQQRHLRTTQELQDMAGSEQAHVRFPCGQCHTSVASNHNALCCDLGNRWYHIRCVG